MQQQKALNGIISRHIKRRRQNHQQPGREFQWLFIVESVTIQAQKHRDSGEPKFNFFSTFSAFENYVTLILRINFNAINFHPSWTTTNSISRKLHARNLLDKFRNFNWAPHAIAQF